MRKPAQHNHLKLRGRKKMRIINPCVRRDIAEGKGLSLNLGSGRQPRPGWYNLDLLPLPAVDIVADLNEPLDALPENCVAEVYSRHTFEHIANLLPLLAEVHRVCRPGARIELVLPHFSDPRGYSDPTHVRFFGLYSFFYFSDEADQPCRKVPSFYIPERFVVEHVRFNLLKQSLVERLLLPPVQRFVNCSYGWMDWYERRLCRWFPVSSVHYVLYPRKVAARRAS